MHHRMGVRCTGLRSATIAESFLESSAHPRERGAASSSFWPPTSITADYDESICPAPPSWGGAPAGECDRLWMRWRWRGSAFRTGAAWNRDTPGWHTDTDAAGQSDAAGACPTGSTPDAVGAIGRDNLDAGSNVRARRSDDRAKWDGDLGSDRRSARD